jgi:hypothetical protein
MATKLLLPYHQARLRIRDADLLLFRPRNFFWRVIAIAGRSEYTHAAMAYWQDGRLRILQETSGERHNLALSDLVRRWPGVIDVYKANAYSSHHFSRARAVAAMQEIVASDYGWGDLLRAACYHLPLVRFLMRPDTDDDRPTRERPFCSQAISMACRRGGVDPVPDLADRSTEPGDLARTTFFEYRFTLIWDETRFPAGRG